MSDKTFYVEQWETVYKVYKVKAKSKEHALEFYWDNTDTRSELLSEEFLDCSETNCYEEKDKEKIVGRLND